MDNCENLDELGSSNELEEKLVKITLEIEGEEPKIIETNKLIMSYDSSCTLAGDLSIEDMQTQIASLIHTIYSAACRLFELDDREKPTLSELLFCIITNINEIEQYYSKTGYDYVVKEKFGTTYNDTNDTNNTISVDLKELLKQMGENQ